MNDDTLELTCQTCKHWHKQPTLELQAQGECRAVPPAVNLIPIGINQLTRQMQMQTVASYRPVPGNFPACGMHAGRVLGREAVTVGNGEAA